jgi:ATP-dependent DNA ligase
VKDAILDGELICLDGDGRSQFMELMRRRRQDVCYYAFDLLWLDGVDLRPLPLLDRKAELRKLVHGKAGILYADHLRGLPWSYSWSAARRIWRALSLKLREDRTVKRHARGSKF